MPQVADLKELSAKTEGFGEGINIQDAPNMLAPTECRRAENGILDERGGFTKRSGCQNLGFIDSILLGLGGPEITDAERTAAALWPATKVGGSNDAVDRRDTPGGFYVGRAATNLFRNGQCDGLGFFGPLGGGVISTTIDLTTIAPWSPQSFKVVVDGASGSQGCQTTLAGPQAAPPGTPGVASFWFKGPAGHTFTAVLQWYNTDSTFTGGPTTSFTATGDWQEVFVGAVVVAAGKTGNTLGVWVQVSGTRADTWWMAHQMMERGTSTVAPYVPTAGGNIATSNQGWVTAPTSPLDPVQGWFACKVKMHSGSSDPTDGANQVVLSFNDGTSNNCLLFYRPISGAGFWYVNNILGGVNTVAQQSISWNRGDTITFIAAWTATQVGISLNGAAFSWVTPPSRSWPTLTRFDIGSHAQTWEVGGAILGASAGKGLLTDADAANLAAATTLAPPTSANETFHWTAVTNQATIAAISRVISCYVYYRGVGISPHFMVHTSAGNVYYTTDPTANPIVWTQIGSGYSASQPMAWETFNSKVYFCDGVSSYSSWDGTTLATYPSAPKAKYLRLWKDTMWASGVANLNDRVYSSAAGDAETWPAPNFVDIRHGDGDAVRALATDGVYLLVGKRNTLSIIYDAALLYNRVSDYEKGIESHWSVIQQESGIFYLTRRGVAEWQGDAPADLISYKIDPIFDPHVLNYNFLEFAWAFADGQKVSWCVPEIGQVTPSMQINYYPRLAELTALGVRGLGPWSIDRMPISCAAMWRYQDKVRVYGGSTIANKLYWVFADGIGTDDGNAFTATLETLAFDFGDELLTKYIRRLRILGRGAFTIQMKRNFQNAVYKTFPVDLSSSSSQWGIGNWNVGNWGPDSNVKEATLNPDAYGRALTLIFSDSSAQAGSKILPVGSKDYAIPTGQWSILGAILDGFLLGVRN